MRDSFHCQESFLEGKQVLEAGIMGVIWRGKHLSSEFRRPEFRSWPPHFLALQP